MKIKIKSVTPGYWYKIGGSCQLMKKSDIDKIKNILKIK